MKHLIIVFVFCLLNIATIAQISQSNAALEPAAVANAETKVRDIDGNVYNTVTIGSQVWMKENLKVTHYRNGDPIQTTIPDTLDISLLSNNNYQWAFGGNITMDPANVQTNKYQWAYNGDENIAATYGRLYSWNAVNDSRCMCPEGWHIPSDKEWNDLDVYLGLKRIAGGKMKEAGTSHWLEPNTDATNESGFSALPAGGRDLDGKFRGIGRYAAWWASSPVGNGAQYRYIEYNAPHVFRTYIYNKTRDYGFSVRCIKD